MFSWGLQWGKLITGFKTTLQLRFEQSLPSFLKRIASSQEPSCTEVSHGPASATFARLSTGSSGIMASSQHQQLPAGWDQARCTAGRAGTLQPGLSPALPHGGTRAACRCCLDSPKNPDGQAGKARGRFCVCLPLGTAAVQLWVTVVPLCKERCRPSACGKLLCAATMGGLKLPDKEAGVLPVLKSEETQLSFASPGRSSLLVVGPSTKSIHRTTQFFSTKL